MINSKSLLASSPPESRQALVRLGNRLRAHRMRLGWTVKDMAARLLCSPTTYRALEAGKPGTSAGILANALWLFGQIDSLENVAPAPVDQVAGRRVRKRAGQPGAGLIGEDERDF
jgi:transcriptional regulator with XRE-family HTH domain